VQLQEHRRSQARAPPPPTRSQERPQPWRGASVVIGAGSCTGAWLAAGACQWRCGVWRV
jgi:hypothetical protein